ncbi:DUF397 domain-containing protein [Streptomyces scopuliridis]|uniref:DUF397 domain-containing protein n=1 Tax=Streptomyces scopuliridis TaxID=452529 RepID=UPI002DD9758A|nr:DUF397 domain-containing protein [Streptomyces scopuliridis]WSB35686.1 DUF397 domain-containing protein [Streptomyces scopuliridis]
MDRECLCWIKSSYSGGSGTECVEVAELADASVIRDSKDPGGARLVFRGAAWGRFVLGVREGQLGG